MEFQAASGPRRAKGHWQSQRAVRIWFLMMSDLHRSAISARLAKLPSSLPTLQDEDDEMADAIGDLPGSGIGPPAMQVMIFI